MHKNSIRAGLIAVTLLVAACAGPVTSPQPAPAPAAREYVLDNGLKVLVLPDRRAPVVVSQLWYKVGGSYEPVGLTGVSHVLEHMMFKGTDKLAPNEFSRIIAAQGGRENAFTGRDYTTYFQRLEKSRLHIAFELEAERMQSLRIDEAEFRKEIEVVKEERRLRTEDRPESLAYEKFMAAAYRNSGYRNPVIGWPEDLDAMQAEDLRVWYRRYYAPNNATLVVVGDVDPEAVRRLADVHFGKVQPRDVPAPPVAVEPPRTDQERVVVSTRARVPYLLMGFHVPVIATAEQDWEPYALTILAHVLDGGKSARLQQNLVRKQEVASATGCGYDPLARAATLFLIDANPATGRNLEELERAVLEQIERLQNELISDVEARTVKAQIVARKVFERDSVFNQGMQLGLLESSGLSWRLAQTMDLKLRAVTPEQIRAVARKYLKPANMAVGLLRPTEQVSIGVTR